jgi:MFS family permease
MRINKNILLLSSAFMFIFFAFGSVERYITTFFSEQGFSNVGFYSLILIYVFFTITNPWVTGFISKYGAKKSMMLGTIMYGFFIISVSINSINLVYVSSALLGISAVLLWVGQSSYLIKASNKENFGANAGIFTTLLFLGSGIGTPLLGFLIKLLSFRLSFLIYSILPFVSIVLLSRLDDFKTEAKAKNFKSILIVFKNTVALKLASTWFALSFVLGLAIGIIPIDITRTLGIVYVGILISAFSIVPLFASYISGKTSDKFGRKNIIKLSYTLLLIGLGLLYLSGTISLVLGIIILALSFTMLRTMTFALLGDIASKNNLETLTSFFWMMTTIGTVFALLLSTLIKTHTTIYLISFIIGTILFISKLSILRFSLDSIKQKLAKEIN